MARPTKYTEETITKLEQAIGMGSTFKLACMYAGISEETLSEWRRVKSGFTERLQKAEGAAALKWLVRIEQAANEGTWQAAAWKLERRYPQEYGRTVQEHTGPDGGAIQEERITRIIIEEAPPRRMLRAEDGETVDAEVRTVVAAEEHGV